MVIKGPKAAWSRRSWNQIVSKKRLAELTDFLHQDFMQRQRDEESSLATPFLPHQATDSVTRKLSKPS